VFAYENHHLLNCSNDVLCSLFIVFNIHVFKNIYLSLLFYFDQVIFLYDLHYNSISFYLFIIIS
jgi:hypothetical protein